MLEKLTEVIVEQLGVEESEVKLGSRFIEDLGADSLDLYEFIMALEEEFGVEIPNEDLGKIKTVNDCVEYIKSKQE